MSSALSLLPIWPPVQSTHSILTTSLFLMVPTDGTRACQTRCWRSGEMRIYYRGANGSGGLSVYTVEKVYNIMCRGKAPYMKNVLVSCWLVEINFCSVSEPFFTHAGSSTDPVGNLERSK